jgi:hypothetical protein
MCASFSKGGVYFYKIYGLLSLLCYSLAQSSENGLLAASQRGDPGSILGQGV